MSHTVSIKLYVGVFATLLVLTGVTAAVAFSDLGLWNNVVMLSIAVTKAVLVILFFMHVRYSGRLTAIVVSAGFFWLLILIFLTLGDFMTRDWIASAPPL